MAEVWETKYLIIGNSAGGIGAAEAIREVADGSLIIVSEEPYPAYSRPLIAKYLTRECTLDDMLFRPSDFYRQHNITPLLGKRVRKLGLDSHTAELESGESIRWGKLLLATGGRPIVPQMEGLDKKGVFTFTTLDDARAIDEFLDRATKAVVIGGGLIGISVTEALVKRGLEVVVVEMKERILNTILDEQASLIAEEVLEEVGVKVIGGHTVGKIVGSRQVEGVILNDGERISCNLVVVAIGVVPRRELAERAGIKVNRGIEVDHHMATSHPDVYACGDVAEAYDFVLGTNRLIPIWPNAYLGGRVAGFNMAGREAKYPGGTAMNSLNYFGLDIAAAGIASPPDGSEYEVLSRRKDGLYRRVVLRNGLVVGMVFVGEVEGSGLLLSLMRERVNVENFKQVLVADDFGLAYLPREVWQSRLGTPTAGLVSLPIAPGEVEDFAGE